MIKFLTLLVLLASALLLGSSPWLSALVYSLVSILQPQYLWPWAFSGFSVFKISAGLAIVAWILQAIKGNIDWHVYTSNQFKGIVLLTLVFHLSTLFSPFKNYTGAVSGDLVVEIFTTIFLMYFFVLGLINKADIIKYFAYIFIFVTLYYTYWANDHYFTGNWVQFTMGRLNGPYSSPYADGNATSILLTIGLSFVMFGIRFFSNKWVKYGLMISTPFVWHALILFASRGALLSAASVTLFFALTVKSRTLTAIMIVGFLGAIVWQGSTLTERTSTTVAQSRDQSIDKPLNPRMVSWQIGWDLAKMYPVFGVGPQRFLFASNVHFPGEAKHVAHNTFLNFSANTGFVSGFIYLTFFYSSFKQYQFVKKCVIKNRDNEYVNLACMGGLVGFFVGALFLDLIIFEPFYLLLALISANYFLVRKLQPNYTH